MNRLFIYSIISFVFFACNLDAQNIAQSSEVTTVLNMLNTPGELPRNFRSQKALNISGSSQFSQEGLKMILKALGNPKKMVIVDLRQECHGFANGNAISWFAEKNWMNLGKTCEEVQKEELEFLEDLVRQKSVTVYKILQKDAKDAIANSQPIEIVVNAISNEKGVVQDLQLQYLRLCVSDHKAPDAATVNQLLTFLKTLPSDTHLHFHCSAGEGRTTTFMTMYDMLKNANTLSLQEIVNRQHEIGGSNLFRLPEKSSWKYGAAVERKEFLIKFYEYCKGDKESSFN